MWKRKYTMFVRVMHKYHAYIVCMHVCMYVCYNVFITAFDVRMYNLVFSYVIVVRFCTPFSIRPCIYTHNRDILVNQLHCSSCSYAYIHSVVFLSTITFYALVCIHTGLHGF